MSADKKLGSAVYWVNRFKRSAVNLQPGEFCIASKGGMIVTVLGSCISVCLHDPELKLGGMNHFMLPHMAGKELLDVAGPGNKSSLLNGASHLSRYGDVAMERLIGKMVVMGCQKDRLVAKVFGGASISTSKVDVGRKNISFITEYLKNEGIPCLAQDVGGVFPRKIYFLAAENEVYVSKPL